MPRRKINVKEPENQVEAMKMIAKLWGWLLKKNPAIFLPLTLWMLFGGLVYGYNYLSADKVTIKNAVPLSENTTQFSIMPQAVAQKNPKDIPIIYNGQLWGYEDTNFVAKVDNRRPIILVYNKITKEVKQVEFGEQIQKQFKGY